jgi:hypothetical protein
VNADERDGQDHASGCSSRLVRAAIVVGLLAPVLQISEIALGTF